MDSDIKLHVHTYGPMEICTKILGTDRGSYNRQYLKAVQQTCRTCEDIKIIHTETYWVRI